MKQRFLDAGTHEAFTAALSGSIAATENAVAVNSLKGRFVRASFALFIAQLLILVLLLATFPPPVPLTPSPQSHPSFPSHQSQFRHSQSCSSSPSEIGP